MHNCIAHLTLELIYAYFYLFDYDLNFEINFVNRHTISDFAKLCLGVCHWYAVTLKGPVRKRNTPSRGVTGSLPRADDTAQGCLFKLGGNERQQSVPRDRSNDWRGTVHTFCMRAEPESFDEM